jgi:UDP-2,3-diacylglucosamine pyrophosphatase LpxH
MRLIVISDIHVGSGVLDDCDSELEAALIEFFRELAKDSAPTEVVINGDFLDFAQAEPWQGADLEAKTPAGTPLCFTEDQSLKKLENIVTTHRQLFDALREYIHSSSDHQILVLPGNHDVDFFWQRIRDKVSAILTNGKPHLAHRLRFHLEQVYRPKQCPGVWIEHGHQHDPCNRFFYEGQSRWSGSSRPVLRDKYGVPRLIQCVGTRFLMKFLNFLDAEYPFVDNVKPFSKFLKMFLASSVNPGFGPLKATIAYWGFLRFLGNSVRKSPMDLLGKSADGANPIEGSKKRLSTLPRSNAEELKARLAAAGFQLGGMSLDFYLKDDSRVEALLEFLGNNLSILDALEYDDAGYLSKGDCNYLTLSSGFIKDETLELESAARAIIRDNRASAVIMGHTHESVNPTTELNYLNIGCWTRYYREGTGKEVKRSWSLLKESSYEHFPYELAYAQVLPSKSELTREIFRP